MTLNASSDIDPPAIKVEGDDAPVKKIDKEGLKSLGNHLDKLFRQYVSDRRIAELALP